MYRRNRHAAQACKKKKYRKAQRQRMLEYDKQHPERRAKISDFVRAVWAKVPDVSEQERIFLRDECSPLTRQVCHKAKNGEKLTPEENRIRKAFYKEFWARHPECRERYKWAWAATKAERAEK